MSEVKEGLALGNKVIALASKLIAPWSTQRQADADSRAAIQGVLTKQLTTYIEQHPNDPVLMDAIIACKGRLGLANIVQIVQQAAPQLNERSRPEDISDDWGDNFRDKASTYSDPDMITLWAQLLAGEANGPGSFSRKTVNVLSDIEPHDAQLFKAVADCRLIPIDPVTNNEVRVGFKRSVTGPKPVIRDCTHSMYRSNGIDVNSLERLDWLGLVNHDVGGVGTTENLRMGGTLAYEYGSGYLLLRGENKSVTVKFGCTSFTPAGIELSELCPIEHFSGFIEFLEETWSSEGILVSRTEKL